MESLVRLKTSNEWPLNFWAGKRVFLSGHTGFKGGWLSLWLWSLGARVMGFSLPPKTEPSLFGAARIDDLIVSRFGDIRNYDFLKSSIDEFKPEIVFHLAAQPLVSSSYEDPIDTFTTNVIGTANLLRAVQGVSSVRAVVNVTTDKCYENDGRRTPYVETDRLGGYDPYSASKACSEVVTSAMYRSFLRSQNVGVATARAGNVVGGGDWSQGRLVPDALAAFDRSQRLLLRNPLHTRPWQHVLDPLHGYLQLAHALFTGEECFCSSWNFGPHTQDIRQVCEVVKLLEQSWGSDTGWALDPMFRPHESSDLGLDISKAKAFLNWSPRWRLVDAINAVVFWHKSWRDGGDARSLCLDQILSFSECRSDIDD